MANVSLKKDFKNGDKLYDHQLNNNFAAIEAALATMNKIVWQDDEENGAAVSTYKGTTEEIEARDLIDGQLLYNTETGETYIDAYVNDVLKRINTGSGNVVAIQSEEPTNDAVKLWVDTDELDVTGTEITDNYSTRDDIGYSARYMNEKFEEINDIMFEYITAGLNASQNHSDTGEHTVVLDKIITSSGSIFTLQNDGGIKCSESCDVEINACLRFGFSNATMKGLFLYINSNRVIELSQQSVTAISQAAPSFYVHLNANDVVYLVGRMDIACAFIQFGTYLSIKKVN